MPLLKFPLEKSRLLGVLLILLITSTSLFGQVSIERSVIGSMGSYSMGTSTQTTLSSTTGEAAIGFGESGTYSLSQGFQQSNYVMENPLVIDFSLVMNETCIGAENGALSIDVFGCPGPYTVDWSNGDTGMVVAELAAGTYTVSVTGSNGCMIENTIDLTLDLEEPCALDIYSGITPNGDGFNEVWIIDNIEYFPGNEVSVHTRSGVEIWSGKEYDNDLVVWNGTNNNGNIIANDTYWYVIKVDGKTFTGWVEVTR